MLSGRPISIGQVMRALEHMSVQFVKLHMALAESIKGSGDDKSAGDKNQDSSVKRSSSQTQMTNNLVHCTRLTGASIESIVWLSWKHLEQFCAYGNAIEKAGVAGG